MTLHLAFMSISFQSQIGFPAVGSECASRRNSLSNESVQAGAGRIRNRAQTNAPDALSILLGADDNQGLEFCLSANCAGFLSTPIGLVHLNHAIQPVTARPNHGPTQLMQHGPSGLVAAQAENPL